MITILGGTGFVGSFFVKELQRRKLQFEVLSRKDTDYTRGNILLNYLQTKRPELLINCAGFTGRPNVELCEVMKLETLQANVLLAEIINDACLKTETTIINCSTGCFFSGTNNFVGFNEDDEPNFLLKDGGSFYATTKYWGEQIFSKNPLCYQVRLRIPFSKQNHPRNYITKLLTYPKLLNVNNSLTCLHDFTAAAIEMYKQKVPFGIYHLTNFSYVTAEYITDLLKKHNITNKKFDFFESEEEFNKITTVKRSNTILNVQKLQSVGVFIPNVEQSLEYCIKNWIN